MADFQSDLFQSAADLRQAKEELGMAIALNHLGGDIYRVKLQMFAGADLHFRIKVSIVAHCSGELSHAHDGNRIFQTLDIAVCLIIPERKLQSEGSRFGMNAVAASHAEGLFMLTRFQLQGFAEAHQF